MVDFGLGDLFKGGEGVSSGVAVAEEADEGEAAVLGAGDRCGVAEAVVEGFVGAFRGGGLEDVDCGGGGDDYDAVGALAGFETAYCGLGGQSWEAGICVDGRDRDDAVA